MEEERKGAEKGAENWSLGPRGAEEREMEKERQRERDRRWARPTLHKGS